MANKHHSYNTYERRISFNCVVKFITMELSSLVNNTRRSLVSVLHEVSYFIDVIHNAHINTNLYNHRVCMMN